MSQPSETAELQVPPLRSDVDAFPVVINGQRLIALRDRVEPAAQPVVLSEAALRVVSLLDGVRSSRAICAAHLLRWGQRLPEEQVRSLIDTLDRAHLLESDRYRQHLSQVRTAFSASEERAAIHAGGAYPGEPDSLDSFLRDWYTHPDGPGGPPGPTNGTIARGLIAPHIDLHRGGATYAWTYRALAETSPADLYVLLGTCHTPMATPLAATRKAYATPFGSAPVDQAFLKRLEGSFDGDLYADELSHRAEHSLEFQTVYLRWLGLVGEGRASVVSLLCGTPHEWVAAGASPLSAEPIALAIEALRTAMAEYPGRVCLVAGADLAHVGPQFGDAQPVSRSVSQRVERDDREMLELIAQGNAEGFYQQVMADQDARRICGLAPIYYLLSLLGPVQGRCLRYSQWVDQAGRGSVTYAGVIFEEELPS